MKDRVTRHPGTTPVEIKTDIQRFSTSTQLLSSLEGKEFAHERIYGSWEDSYGLLPSYVIRLSGIDPVAKTCLVRVQDG